MSEKAAVIKGHGHVTPNADGYLARCGGPTICKVCKAELAALKAQPSEVVVPERREVGPQYPYLSSEDLEWNACLDEVARLNSSPVSSAPSHGEQVRDVPSVQITGHLDEVDAPVWEFINAEARKLGPITGSIDSYGLSRPNGGQPNGGVVVLWNGQKIHAVALAVRDAMNRTQCIRLLAAAPSPACQKEQGE